MVEGANRKVRLLLQKVPIKGCEFLIEVTVEEIEIVGMICWLRVLKL